MIGLLFGRHPFPVRIWLLTVALVLLACPLYGQDEISEVKYNRDIRPILAEHCFACHGTDSVSRKADLRLDQREAAIDLGAISEGDPDDSELIARVESDDEDLVMPPPSTKKPVTEKQKKIAAAMDRRRRPIRTTLGIH